MLPLSSASTVGSPTDLTFKFWFKAMDVVPNQSLQFFSFEQSVICYITDVFSIMCDTPERQRLIVNVDNFTAGKWYYFSMSVTNDGFGNLSIYDKYGLIASDDTSDFFMVQVPTSNWGVCFGACDTDANGMESGFRGGIREVVVCDEIEPNLDSNIVRIYKNGLKGYFRFASSNPKRFAADEYSEKDIIGNFEIDKAFGRDMIANDICPRSFDTGSFPLFSSEQQVMKQRFGKRLQQNRYAYTMSITMLVDSNTCVTKSFLTAQNQDCNIVLVEDVFMLFFSAPGAARFHFFAEKNYFESQSSAFFIPFNQWITIQMHMTQIDGYQIVVLDQNGEVLLNFARQRSMYSQVPKNEFSLFSGLSGYVDRFIFTDKAYYLPKSLSGRLDDSPIIDISFQNTNSTNVRNIGRGDDVQLALAPISRIIPYYMVEFGAPVVPYPEFDGIACNDLHTSMKMATDNSFFKFETPPMQDWMSETSINFWFKVQDWKQFTSSQSTLTHSILTMQSGNGFQSFWFVFVRGGELVVAPFGLQRLSEPVVIFSEFNRTNADNLGWWHLSCYYQFYAKIECTLHNQNVDVTRVQSLMGNSDYFFPQYSLTATVGKTQFQTFPGASSLLVKELSYWSRKVMLPEAKVLRYHQIDPTQARGLLTYFRLSNGIPTVQNFAEFSPTYTFQGTRPRYSQAVWQADLLITEEVTYDEASSSLVMVDKYHYHNVCPLYTYHKDQLCYREPVNEPRVMFFPKWNTTSSALDWLFTLGESTYSSPQLQQQVTHVWSADDSTLESFLSNAATSVSVPSVDLRNENDYQVMGSLTNAQSTFSKTAHAHFIPNKCHWFDVGLDNSFEGFREITVMPGVEDFQFKLTLQNNDGIDCTDFQFFDSFNSVQFEFVPQNDQDTYMIEQPKVNIRLESSSSVVSRTELNQATEGPEVEEEARTQKDLVVYVTVPSEEQYKIPVWTDIKILMTIDWSSSKFQNFEMSPGVFQNAMYRIKFNPKDNYLIAKVNQNLKFVQKTQTLILSANETTVSGLFPSQVESMLSYEWLCPEGMELLCKGQNSNTLYIPWNRIASVPLNFSTLYQFGAEVTWTKPDGSNETRKDMIQVQWYNLQKPIFEIVSIPDQILVTSTRDTEFEIIGTNFDHTSDMSIYQIDWVITPPLQMLDSQDIFNFGQRIRIAAGSWDERTDYMVTAKLYFQDEPSINGTYTMEFKTSAPPKNGTVSISPDFGYIDDTFTIIVNGFVDPNNVLYNVFVAFDAEGTLKGSQLNNRTMPQVIDYRYKATSANPLIVEVVNSVGEKVTFVLYPWIVPKPDPICTTEIVCPPEEEEVPSDNSTETANQTNTTDADGRRLQRQNVRQTQTPVAPEQTNSSDIAPCEYNITCVQPEYDFTQPRPFAPESGNNTSNETVPVDNGTDTSTDGGRRLSTQDICKDFTQSSNIDDALAAFDLTGQMCILDAVLTENNQQLIIEKLQQFANYETEYHSDNIQIASVVFNIANAAEKDIEPLFALDVEYDLNTEALLWQFPDQPKQDFMMQAIAVKTETTQVVFTVIDSMTGDKFAIKDLDGQASLKFRVTPETYLSGQTVCQGLLNDEWVSDVCLTEIDIQQELASCMCGLTQDVTTLSFRNDMSLAQGESVEFPVEHLLITPEFKGTSFFFMGVVSILSFVGIFGSLVAWKLDRNDQTEISDLSGWKLNLVMAVAAKLNQSVEQVKLRQKELTTTQSRLSIIGKVHPLFAPFTTMIATQSRLLRFSAYHLQVNLFVLGCMVHFGPSYRATDSLRQEIFLDSADVSEISLAAMIGSIVLLPIISEPVSWLLRNKIHNSESGVEVKRQCLFMRVLFMLGCMIVNLSTVIAAVSVCKNAPTANQYVLATSVFLGFFMATVGTNMLRSGVQALAPISFLTTQHAQQLISDLNTAAEIDLTKFKIVSEADFASSRVEEERHQASVEHDDSGKYLNTMRDKQSGIVFVETQAEERKRGKSVLW